MGFNKEYRAYPFWSTIWHLAVPKLHIYLCIYSNIFAHVTAWHNRQQFWWTTLYRGDRGGVPTNFVHSRCLGSWHAMTSQQSSLLSLVMTGLGHRGVGEGGDGRTHTGIQTRLPWSHRHRWSHPSSVQSPWAMVMFPSEPKYTQSVETAVVVNSVGFKQKLLFYTVPILFTLVSRSKSLQIIVFVKMLFSFCFFLNNEEIRDTGIHGDQISHIQSMVDKRVPHKSGKRSYPYVKRFRLKHSTLRIPIPIQQLWLQLDITNLKLKMPTRGSEATRAETRNRTLSFGPNKSCSHYFPCIHV